MAYVAAAAHFKSLSIGGITVVTDAEGEAYRVITAEQLRELPFWPQKWTRGRSRVERCMLAVWDTFEDPEGSRLSNYVNIWIMGLIIGSAVVAVIETIPDIHKSQESVWEAFEHFFIANFTVEFVCKLLSCPSCRLFWTTGMNYVDLIAILPYYVDLLYLLITGSDGGVDLAFLRILRLGRAFRLVKLGRYSQGVKLVTNAMSSSADALNLFLLVLVLVLVVFSSGIYYLERGEWNEFQELYYRKDPNTGDFETTPSTFQSIPACFWWCVATLTTVGYGDLYPYSTEGKVMGAITILVGLVLLALPLSILGTNFVEERAKMMETNRLEKDEGSDLPQLSLFGELEALMQDSNKVLAYTEELRVKVNKAREVMDSICKGCDIPVDERQLWHGTGGDVDDIHESIDPDHQQPTCTISEAKIELFQHACGEILATALLLKDNHDPLDNGLSSLPCYVRDFVLPRIPSSDLKRPYVILDDSGNKLFFGDELVDSTSVVGVMVHSDSEETETSHTLEVNKDSGVSITEPHKLKPLQTTNIDLAHQEVVDNPLQHHIDQQL